MTVDPIMDDEWNDPDDDGVEDEAEVEEEVEEAPVPPETEPSETEGVVGEPEGV